MAGKGKPGPREKMTPAAKRHFVQSLTLGLSQVEACLALGVDRETVRKARIADPQFSERVKKAAAAGKRHHLQRVHLGVPNWQSSAWFLERKYGAEFGQKVRVDHGGQLRVVEEVVGATHATPHPNGNGHTAPGAGRIPGL